MSKKHEQAAETPTTYANAPTDAARTGGPVRWDAGGGFWCIGRIEKRGRRLVLATTLYNPDGSINSIGSRDL